MIEFASKHANKKQYETSVPFVLPNCIFTLRDSGVLEWKEYDELTKDPELLAEIITALQGLAANNTQNIFGNEVQDKKFLQTLLALYLDRAGRVDEAERVYRELEGQHSPFAMKLFGRGAAGSLDALSARASAMNAEYGIEATQLQELMKVSLAERIENLDAIEELVNNISLSDESGGLFFARALKKVRQEKAYSEGKVVNIDFDDQMNMWKMSDNRQLTYISETAATFDNRNGDRQNAMIYDAAFPGPRVTEMTFTFPTDSAPNPKFAPGIVIASFGQQDYTLGVAISEELAFQRSAAPTKPDDIRTGLMIFGTSYGAGPAAVRFPYRSNRCKLRVLTDKHWIEVYADDQYVFSYRNTAFENLAQTFALRMTRGVGGSGQVEVSDITIQKWSLGAPPETRISRNLVKHFQNKLDAEPNDKWNQFWLAHAFHNHGDTVKALKLYLQSVESGVNKQIAGFYIGDILDREGKRKEAFDWYVESATNASNGGLKKLMYAHNNVREINQEVNWSAFRAKWLIKTCGFEMNEADEIQLSRLSKIPYEINWLEKTSAFFPRDDAPEIILASKIRYLNDTIKKTPDSYKYIPTEIKEAIEAEGVYKVSPDSEPLYLKVKEATPFFRSIDKIR
ncbi:hypothetical protein [Mariniblastus fucicola]|uniref:Tetratricopeptide repeat protein n=1 Tax=Mariniblastus fucicola TaxID=980251 RepID=A0A5B9PAQ7_9BACT|nr:hypothetical protein [Mariniblastus fucicola]QEG23344.1 hypothetical protein MFFC18_32420 [Mariniblastus fucicola]